MKGSSNSRPIQSCLTSANVEPTSRSLSLNCGFGISAATGSSRSRCLGALSGRVTDASLGATLSRFKRVERLRHDRWPDVAERFPQDAVVSGASSKLLKQLPGIGEPGADRILMIAGSVKTLAPDSNGARVLCRLGFGKDSARYDRMYRSVIQETMPELPDTPSWWLRAHQLLRQHGQSLCRRNAPRCRECPLAPRCPSAR